MVMRYVFNQQLSTNLLTAYYNESSTMVLPESSPETENDTLADRKALVAQAVANFASLGYQFNTDAVTRLSQASTKDILAFYDTYYTLISDQLGTRFAKAHTFYPDFPKQVIGKDRGEIFFDQLIYALSGFQYTPAGMDSDTRFTKENIVREYPFLGQPVSRGIIKTIPYTTKDGVVECEDTRHAIRQRVDMVMHSLKPYTHQQLDCLQAAIAEDAAYRQKHQNLLGTLILAKNNEDFTLPNHENRATLAYLLHKEHLLNHSKYARLLLTEAKDVLMFANLVSCQPQLKELSSEITNAPGVYKLRREERKLIFWCLEAIAEQKDLTIETWHQKEVWKRLYKSGHIGEFEKQFPKTAQSAQQLRLNLTPERYESLLEAALDSKNPNLETALALAIQRPGILCRRANQLLMLAEQESDKVLRKHQIQQVVDAIKTHAHKAGISAVLDMTNALKNRGEDETSRSFRYPVKGEMRTFQVDEKCRKALQPETMELVSKLCEYLYTPEGLAPRFANKDLGLMYVSPEASFYTVPMDTKEISPGTKSLGSGSAVATNADTDIYRFFLQWTNIQEHDELDVDLSAQIIYPDSQEFVTWNRDYSRDGVTHSGDIRNGGSPDGNGAVEYIDVPQQQLKEAGAKYVILTVESYSCAGSGMRAPFIEQPNTYFGWMRRNEDDHGKLYEEKTVEARYKLVGNALKEVAAIFDLEHDRVVWIDRQMPGRVATEDREQTMELIDRVLDQVLPLDVLVKANALANNGYTTDEQDMDKAQILVMTQEELDKAREEHPEIDFDAKQIVLPTDLSYLTSVLLADGPKQAKVQEKQKDVIEFPSSVEQTKPVSHKHKHSHDDMMR